MPDNTPCSSCGAPIPFDQVDFTQEELVCAECVSGNVDDKLPDSDVAAFLELRASTLRRRYLPHLVGGSAIIAVGIGLALYFVLSGFIAEGPLTSIGISLAVLAFGGGEFAYGRHGMVAAKEHATAARGLD